tara:strand:- start:692 stop:916 length:225 start_codon:yes stop_codon:yes gene_type:complete
MSLTTVTIETIEEKRAELVAQKEQLTQTHRTHTEAANKLVQDIIATDGAIQGLDVILEPSKTPEPEGPESEETP